MTGAQQELLGKAHRTVRSARLLLNDGDHDGAVSRAYYAMFYAAHALLLEKGMSFSSHAAVISAFGKAFAKSGVMPVEYHRYLIDSHDARNSSDYEAVSHLTGEDAARHIAHADQFLEAGERILR